VRVPARADSLNSEGVPDSDAAFAQQFLTGASWPDFPMEVKWIVELEAAGGEIGIGETYRGATAEAVGVALRSFIGQDVLKLPWRRLAVSDSRVYDAMESAVLDLSGRLLGLSVAQLLGGCYRTRIECSGWTGRRTPADAARKAAEAMARGHRVFKFKCSSGDPVREWAEAIAKSCGDGIRILLDPNQRWVNAENTLRMMDGVDPSIMFGLEDPVLRSDIEGFCELRAKLGISLFAHIALPYDQDPADALRFMNRDAVDGFNFNGPMFRFVELAAAAELQGLPCWHGSEVDLGVLEVSALHACAAAPGCTIPSDIFGELVRENDLIEEPIRFEGGLAVLPEGPGLGVRLDRAALRAYQSGEALAF
jgi:muconate cycloisomerase